MGSADTASPSGMSSMWCSCASTWRAKYERVARRSGRDMVGAGIADAEGIEKVMRSV